MQHEHNHSAFLPYSVFFFLIIIIQFVLAHVVLIAIVVHEKFSIKEH